MIEHSVVYGDERIRFTVRTQARRVPHRIAIHVEPDGCVQVDAPPGASIEQVKAAVMKRARWVSGHVEAARLRRAQVVPREYVSGESLLYLGRRYCLKVRSGRDGEQGAFMHGPFIEVHAASRDPETVRGVLEAWYRASARTVLGERLAALAAPMQWVRQLPPIRLQTMSRQWGSCSPSGRITLNPALVKAPRECVDYVLMHELVHLRHHDHSKRFYQALGRAMPNWQCAKSRLDDLADQLLDRPVQGRP